MGVDGDFSREAVARELGLALDRLHPAQVDHAFQVAAREGRAALHEALTVRETHLLRHPEQLAVLRELAPSLSRPGQPLRVWSAGCASGEEAYSLAAVLGDGARVLGTDLVPSALETARRGSYRLWSLRGVDLEQESGWLRHDGLGVQVSPEVKARVEFQPLNLASDPFPYDLDVVFCRNVLLYFEASAAEQVHRRIAEAVRPGGLLFLGPADPEPAAALGWVAERRGTVRWFRRADPAARAAPPPQKVAPPAPRRPPSRPTPLPGPPPEQEVDPLELARQLSDAGSPGDALRLLLKLTRERPLDPAPHALLAMVAEELGELESALNAARSAVFLAPELPCTHYFLAVCLHRAGHPERARLHLRLAEERLANLPDPNRPLRLAQGLTGHQLARMIDVFESR